MIDNLHYPMIDLSFLWQNFGNKIMADNGVNGVNGHQEMEQISGNSLSITENQTSTK